MANEFDDLIDPRLGGGEGWPGASVGLPRRRLSARLVSRLYRTAQQPLRARLLTCLLLPLGTLGLASVAAGAFSGFLRVGVVAGARTSMGDIARFSNEQIAELARFVEQVSPEALQEFARLISENPVGVATFSASAAVLLLRSLQSTGSAELVNSRGRLHSSEE